MRSHNVYGTLAGASKATSTKCVGAANAALAAAKPASLVMSFLPDGDVESSTNAHDPCSAAAGTSLAYTTTSVAVDGSAVLKLHRGPTVEPLSFEAVTLQ